MLQKELSGVSIECIQGDIASQEDMAAVVNAANAQLRPGGGVAGAIHRAAGPALEQECRSFAPIRPGEAVITSGHNLSNRYVIHCLGPVYGIDTPEDVLLAQCYRRALQIADEHHIDSVAFPAISAGAFGYPIDEAAAIAMQTIAEMSPELQSVRKIRSVLYSAGDVDVFQTALSRIN